MSKLIVKEHCDSRFSKMIRFYSKEFPIDRVRVARLISTGVRSPVCQPTDIKIVEVRYVTYISIVVSDVTSAVHIRRQTPQRHWIGFRILSPLITRALEKLFGHSLDLNAR